MEKLIHFFYGQFLKVMNDKFFLFAVFGTLLEYVFFILIIGDSNAESIKIRSAIVGVPSMLLYVSFAVIPYFFVFLMSGILQRIFIIVVNMCLSLFMIADLWYFRGYSSFLNYYMLGMTDNLDGTLGSVFAMFRPVDILFIISPIILTVLVIKNLKVYSCTKKNYIKFILLLTIPLFYIGYSHIKVDIFDKGYKNQYIFKRAWAQTQMMFNLTPIGYHIFDLFNYLEDNKPFILKDSEKELIKNFYNNKERNLPENNYFGKYKGYNLIVIQIESMEAFVIDENIDGQVITPNLNKLKEKSLYFSNYHEQTHSGMTSDAVFVSNNSIYPPITGSHNYNYTYNSYNSLPKILETEGYNTYSMHPENGSYWNWMAAEIQMGFDNCYDLSDFKQDEIIQMGLSDKSLMKQLPVKLKENKEPFYSFSITLTSHTPFKIPDKDKSLKLPSYLENTKTGAFLQAVNYTDKAVGEFLNDLDKMGIMDNTIVAIYGDHEGVSKFFNTEIQGLDIPEKWKNNSKKVPLFIYAKGMEGKIIDIYGGQVDFLPTISYLLGINEDKYVNTAMGRVLLNTKMNFVITTTRKYFGDNISEIEKKNKIKDIDISNLLIKSNYFKDK